MATYKVSLNDPSNMASMYRSAIQATAEAAAGRWLNLVQGFGSIDIQVNFTSGADFLATGGSASSAYVGEVKGITILQQGAPWELQTGIDVNGTAPDLIVTLNADRISEMFFDPTMSSAVPGNKFDAATIFLHEIGHGLAVNSFRGSGGSLPGGARPYQQVYDTFVTINGSSARFSGPNSNLVSGGVALVGADDVAHFADTSDLMYSFLGRGDRRGITNTDIAVAQDIGLAIATERADYITLLSGNDIFVAGGGDDTIIGGMGNDSIVGGFGRDAISGGEGNDVILANQDDDIVLGNQGNDIVVGGQGKDIVVGEQSNDFVFGNESDDFVFGNEGNDTIFAGQGNDTVFAGRGNDTIWGNEGDDILYGNEGADRFIFGLGSGADTIRGFNSAEGDVLDLMGQNSSQQAVSGGILIALSGGGSILLEGAIVS